MNSPISAQFVQSFSEKLVSVRQLLAVGEQKRSGLILCKPFYAEFAGPGAAISNLLQSDYSTIIAIGSPELVEVVTHEERQKAYSRRIQWVRWLHKIVAQPEPTHRAEKLLAGFEEFFGCEILAGIPDVTLSLLAGVLPQTISTARAQKIQVTQIAQVLLCLVEQR